MFIIAIYFSITLGNVYHKCHICVGENVVSFVLQSTSGYCIDICCSLKDVACMSVCGY